MGDSANLDDKNLKIQILAEYTVIASCLCNSVSGYKASNRFVMVIDETGGRTTFVF